MSDKILIALDKLDAAADEQWTADGLPVVAVVQELAEDESITRKMITDVAPFFNRDVAAGNMPADNKDGPAEPEDDGPKLAEGPVPVAGPAPGQPRMNPKFPDLKVPEPQDLEDELEDLNKDMAELTKIITDSKKELGDLRNRYDQLISWRDAGRSADPHANQREIMRALHRSQEERAKRAAVHAALMDKLSMEGAEAKRIAEAVSPVATPIEKKGKKKGR